MQEAQASQQDSDIRKKRRRLAAAQKRAVELTPEEQESFYSEVFNLLQIRD